MSFGAFRPFGLFAPFRANPIAAGIASLFTPAVLFENNEQGLWYDTSDFSTMFQDSAGTTPVTAGEQPVGLILDKRLGLVRGPELITNGDFGAGTTGWTAFGGTITSVSGTLRVTEPDAVTDTARGYQTITCVVGRSYEVTGTLVAQNLTTTALIAAAVGVTGAALAVSSTGIGSKRLIFVATATSIVIRLSVGDNVAGAYADFDNISVKELPGNHASQATAASRPVLSARVNQFIQTAAFQNSAWTKRATYSGSGNVITNSGNAAPTEGLWQQIVGLNGPYTVSGMASSGTASTIRLVVKNNTTDTIVAQQSFALTPTPTFISLTGITAGATPGARIEITTDGVSGTINFVPQVEFGTIASRYQQVTTATDYDTLGFPHYLKFDGVDDWLQTASIDFTGTDKVNVFAGVRKLSDAAAGTVLELSASSPANNGTFAVFAPQSVATAHYGFRSRGTASQDALLATFAAPITSIVTGIGDIAGDLSRGRVGGAVIASNTGDQGTGNYGNYPIYIGRRGGTTLPFNGHLYQLVVRGALSTDARILETEEFIGNKIGVEI